MRRTGIARHVIFLAAAFLLAVDGYGQDPPPLGSTLMVGSRGRIRYRPQPGTRARGMVAAIDDQTLTLAAEDRLPVKIPLASITALDLSTGRRRHTLLGMGIGVAAGLAVGLAAWEPYNCTRYSTNPCSRGEAAAAGAVGGGLIGAGIGALMKSDRWVPVPVVGSRRVGQRALGLAIKVRL